MYISFPSFLLFQEPKPDDKPKVEETILEAEAAKEECSGNDLISPAKEKEECKLEKEDIQEYQDRDYENTEEDFERCESHSQSLDAEEDDVIVVRRGQFIEQKPSNQTPGKDLNCIYIYILYVKHSLALPHRNF